MGGRTSLRATPGCTPWEYGVHVYLKHLRDLDVNNTSSAETRPEGKSGLIDPQLGQVRMSHRHGSPSDAVMIRRLSNSPANLCPDELNAFLSPENSTDSQSHKRSVSAPDFTLSGSGDFTDDASTGNHGSGSVDAMPKMENLAVTNGGGTGVQYTSDTTWDDPEAFLKDTTIRCMYIDNCDTNSQPRKAISHIFGRNKLCTRSIPDNIWVHYCRKHYQRSRYRNAQEYAKTQCDLVLKQIQRVQLWSNRNQREGKSGVVQNWSLSVRKREQKRIDDKAGMKNTNNKRPFAPQESDENEDDEDVADRAVATGTAVPPWLLAKCGSGYTTEQMNEIVEQLRVQMDAGHLTQIPDIEILPNVITDGSSNEAEKKYTKRKNSAKTHERSKSFGVGLRPSVAGDPFASAFARPGTANPAAAYWAGEDPYAQAGGNMPYQKRARVGEPDYYGVNRGGFPTMPLRTMDRTVPNIRRMPTMTMPRRPSFPENRENAVDDRLYDERYSMPAGPQGPLPAPTAHRQGANLMAEQLESTQTTAQYPQDMRSRPTHQRSYSDVSIHGGAASMGTYRPSPVGYSLGGNGTAYGAPNGYTSPAGPATPAYHPAESNPYTDGYNAAATMRQDAWATPTSTDSSGPPGYYDELPQRSQAAGTGYGATGSPSMSGYYTAAPVPTGSNGPAKHVRHQSQPQLQNVPRMGAMMRTYANAAPGQNPYAFNTGYGAMGAGPMGTGYDPTTTQAFPAQSMRYNPDRARAAPLLDPVMADAVAPWASSSRARFESISARVQELDEKVFA
ncbi:hypothetical protein P8C59_004555 [Phyllachora maydis]|uniref:ORP1 like protein n=1 Tax=Phyllachora maydis TaxID=1825666 RepID=A0AAD9MCK3_9PEZI|nr:hypothetical protein P8C59_004555 [Phyllachora maydis]